MKDLYKLINEYKNCDLCSLKELRIKKNAQIAFGQGCTTARTLLIVPSPIYNTVYTPYGEGTEEYEGILKLWKEAGIEPADIYIVPSYMCPKPSDPSLEHQAIKACNSRLIKVLQILKPSIVLLSGNKAIEAFYGPTVGQKFYNKYGPLDHPSAEVFSIMDLSEYYAEKTTANEIWIKENSIRILKHWKNVAQRIKTIS